MCTKFQINHYTSNTIMHNQGAQHNTTTVW